jgi:sugar phosphate isomerase/epimerase
MKLTVSNLAWNVKNSNEMFSYLKSLGINNVEGVLSKIDTWDNLLINKIYDYKFYLDSNNISIPSLQSLFYNVDCQTIFDEIKFISHIEKLIHFSKILSVKVLVFGSPSLRKKIDGWESHLINIFKKIDKLLEGTDIEISIEPNSKIYGGDFFHSISEIVDFITKNNLQNIKTMIDTHNLILEGDDPINYLELYYDYINHIHISENKLKPIEDIKFHLKFSDKIKKLKYDKVITYEVIECDNIYSSIDEFYKIYK